jgi:hypothetical protein
MAAAVGPVQYCSNKGSIRGATVAVDVEQVEARMSALQAAVADLAELPWHEVPLETADEVIAGVESAQRTLSVVGYGAIRRRREDVVLGRGRRLRDHLANLLHISATEAGARIATAATSRASSRVCPRRRPPRVTG